MHRILQVNLGGGKSSLQLGFANPAFAAAGPYARTGDGVRPRPHYNL